jgi:formamidopyrimidine-DNA glycosylase
MPELPEVEITRRNLERWFRGHRVVSAEAEQTRIFRGANRTDFERLRGGLVDASRKGKYLLLTFENEGLLAHLGMTGKFVRRPAGVTEPYSRARLFLENKNAIHYRDPRMFGRLIPVEPERLWDLEPIRELGRDPLTDGLTAKQLEQAVGASGQAIKVALMDQKRIAGLGNINACEALFRAGIHPARKPKSLSPEEWKKLARAIHAAIRYAIERLAGEEIQYLEEPGAENPFLIYGRAGEPCPKRNGHIQTFVLAGRTTYYCPKCQPRWPAVEVRDSRLKAITSTRP